MKEAERLKSIENDIFYGNIVLWCEYKGNINDYEKDAIEWLIRMARKGVENE